MKKKKVIILCLVAMIVFSVLIGVKCAIIAKINKLESGVVLNYNEVSPTYSEPATPMTYDVIKYDLMWNLEKNETKYNDMDMYSNEHMDMLIKKDSYNLPAKRNGENLTVDCDAERNLFREKSDANIFCSLKTLLDKLHHAMMKNAVYSYTSSSTLYAFDKGDMKFSIIDTSSGMYNVEVFIPGENYYVSFLIIDKDADITAANVLDFASRISFDK